MFNICSLRCSVDVPYRSMFGRCAIDARSMLEQRAVAMRPLYDNDDDGGDDGDDDVYEHGVAIISNYRR